ncbi:MAG TPA: DUF6249 domain-containing protein [Vicinamibacterales bacterium]|nr:DUF6249 domain-containing protein [Vicinamibacterales bacterium]
MDNGLFFEALSVVWVFGFVIVLLVAWHLRQRRQIERLNMIHAERMKAMEKGIPLPELVTPDDDGGSGFGVSLRAAAWNPRWPLGVGALLVMGGLGTSVAFRLSSVDFHRELWPFGLIGVFLGVGMFFYYALTKPPSSRG